MKNNYIPKKEKHDFLSGLITIIKGLFSYLFFLPYGTKLLNISSLIWLSFGFFATYGMSLVEFASWYAILDFQLPQQFKQYSAHIIIPFLIALLIWFIDITFLFLDFSEVELDENNTDGKKRRYQLFGLRMSKQLVHFIFIGAPIRLGILAVAFWFTAPQLAKLLVLDDINQYVVFEQQQRKDQFLENKQQQLNLQRNEIKKENDQVSLLMSKELGGQKGERLSGLSGKGPRYYALEETYQSNLRKLAETENKRLKIERDFAQFSYNQLVQNYGIKPIITEDKDLISKRLVEEKQKRTLSIDNIAKILLGLFFCSIILLKIVQPHSVKIYLNQFLQAAYDDYQKGAFDNEMLNKEKVNIYTFEKTVQSYYIQGIFEAKQLKIQEKIKLIDTNIAENNNQIALIEGHEKNIQINNKEQIQKKLVQYDLNKQEIQEYINSLKKQKKQLQEKLSYTVF